HPPVLRGRRRLRSPKRNHYLSGQPSRTPAEVVEHISRNHLSQPEPGLLAEPQEVQQVVGVGPKRRPSEVPTDQMIKEPVRQLDIAARPAQPVPASDSLHPKPHRRSSSNTCCGQYR